MGPNAELCAGIIDSKIYIFDRRSQKRLMKFTIDETSIKIEAFSVDAFSGSLSVVTIIEKDNPLPKSILIQGYRRQQFYHVLINGRGQLVQDGSNKEASKAREEEFNRSINDDWDVLFTAPYKIEMREPEKFHLLFDKENTFTPVSAFFVGRSLSFKKPGIYLSKIAGHARLGDRDSFSVDADKGFVTISIDKNDLNKSLICLYTFIDNKATFTAYNAYGEFDSRNEKQMPSED